MKASVRPVISFLGKRNYYSYTAIPGLNRKHPFPMQAEVPKTAPPLSGYNLAMHRLANIALALLDRQAVKTLHVFPESSFSLYLSDQTHVTLDMTGISTYKAPQTFFGHKNYSRIYQSTEITPEIKAANEPPFKDLSYELIAQMLPVFKQKTNPDSPTLFDPSTAVNTISPLGYNIADLIPLLNYHGYLVVGYPETLWNSLQIREQFTAIAEEHNQKKESKYHGELRAIFKILMAAEDLIAIDQEELREHHHDGAVVGYPSLLEEDKLNENIPSLRYVIAVFKKE